MTLPIKLEKAIDEWIETNRHQINGGEESKFKETISKKVLRTLKDSPDIISVGFVIDGKWVEIRNA